MISGPFRSAPIVLRVLLGVVLSAYVATALAAPEFPAATRLSALVLFAITLWRPAAGMVAVAAVAPAGMLLARAPLSAAELLAWSFLAGWLLAVWRPLGVEASSREVRVAVALYAAVAVASWIAVVIKSAAGIAPDALPRFLWQSIPPNYLVFSSPSPAGRRLAQTLGGLGVFIAAAALSRGREPLIRRLAYALVASTATLAVLTAIAVARDWAKVDYGAWYLLRYVHGERFSLHMDDLNAAGSLYILGGLVAAALAMTEHRRRVLWIGAIAVMIPALGLSGSRTAAAGALIVGGILLFSTRLQWRPSRGHLAVVVVLALAVAGGTMVVTMQRGDARGSAGMSLRLRAQFLQTSARMIATAPILGVGIGQYLPRSPEFMPAALRAIYPAENAHNFFVQQFAELGVIGGALFVGLIWVGLARAWGAIPGRASGAALGLLAGTAAYLLTCVTGHPLLVPEAAIPFWIAFGAVAALAPAAQAWPVSRRTAITTAITLFLLLTVSVGIKAAAYRRGVGMKVARGLHGQEIGPDGTRFSWATEHAVLWVLPDPGFLTVPLRAPDFLHRKRPFVADIFVDGRPTARAEVPPGEWVRVSIALRRQSAGPARRIDVRVNQWWTARKDRDPSDTDTRPMSVMVGEVRLERTTGER